jgi:hypothetical protein
MAVFLSYIRWLEGVGTSIIALVLRGKLFFTLSLYIRQSSFVANTIMTIILVVGSEGCESNLTRFYGPNKQGVGKV